MSEARKAFKNPEIKIGVPNSYDEKEEVVYVCYTVDTCDEKRSLETLDHEFLHHIVSKLIGREISRKLDSTRLGKNLIRWIFRGQRGELLGQKVTRYGPKSWVATPNPNSVRAKAKWG